MVLNNDGHGNTLSLKDWGDYNGHRKREPTDPVLKKKGTTEEYAEEDAGENTESDTRSESRIYWVHVPEDTAITSAGVNSAGVTSSRVIFAGVTAKDHHLRPARAAISSHGCLKSEKFEKCRLYSQKDAEFEKQMSSVFVSEKASKMTVGHLICETGSWRSNRLI